MANLKTNPEISSSPYSAVNEHRTLFGPTKSFDGNKLYLPKQLPDIGKAILQFKILSEDGCNLKSVWKPVGLANLCFKLFFLTP